MGPDCSLIRFSELENALTLGAEYYASNYLEAVETICALPKVVTLGSLCGLITDGDHGSADYVDQGIAYVLSEAVQEGWIDLDACRKISALKHASLRRSRLRPGDVVVTKTGMYFGKSSVIPEELEVANTIAHVGKLEVREGMINPFYLSTFLNCRYGYLQLRRRGIKATRPEIKLVEFPNVKVPIVSIDLQERIERAIRDAWKRIAGARLYNRHAHEEFDRALKLENWRQPDSLAFTARASSVLGQGRIDAQFFLPLHASLQRHVKALYNVRELGELGEVTKGISVPYYDDGDIPVVRSGDLQGVEISECLLSTRSSERAFLLEKGDVLVSSIGFGSIGNVQVFNCEGSFATVGEVTVIRQRALNPYFLAAFLRSRVGQIQINRLITGATGQLHLYPRDMRSVWIPLMDSDRQRQYETLAIDSEAERRMGRAILERCKRAVEIAIEDSESAALNYLESAETCN